MEEILPLPLSLTRRSTLLGAGALSVAARNGAKAQTTRAQSNGPIRIGVLCDLAGREADHSGQGSIMAARMAAAEFDTVLGQTVEILQGDTQGKPDVAAVIARQWYDQSGVDAIVDMPLTTVAAAVQQLAIEKRRIVAVTTASSSDLTVKWCSPFSTHWADDSMAQSQGSTSALIKAGRTSWYFITADYSFGQTMQGNAEAAIKTLGGSVVGSVRFPIGATDYSSEIVRAQNSGADAVALVAVGADLVNLIKQCFEFGMNTSRQALGAFSLLTSDVASLGLEATKGLYTVSSFYWDDNEKTRAWSTRFLAERKSVPIRTHAHVYLATRHILACMQKTGSRDAVAVNQAMRATPVDFFGRYTDIRPDGRLMSEIGVFRVKSPAESKGRWDFFDRVGSVSPQVAFAPMNPACNA